MKFRASQGPWTHQQLTGAGVVNRHVALLNYNIFKKSRLLNALKLFVRMCAAEDATPQVYHLHVCRQANRNGSNHVDVCCERLLFDLQVSAAFPRCCTGNLIAIHPLRVEIWIRLSNYMWVHGNGIKADRFKVSTTWYVAAYVRKVAWCPLF